MGLVLTGVAIGGGFIAMDLMPLSISLVPVFFTPAVVIGLITLGVFIATLVYTIQNNIDRNQLAQNKTIIQENIQTISQQHDEINALEHDKITTLKGKILSAEQNIMVIDKRIETLQQQAALQFANAEKVGVATPGNQAFFENHHPYSLEA
ncbi:MAG: hypothetical protein ACRCXC_13640 [Legionella sp.]